ncbi:MAG TPA: glycosyltransferase family 2 protein [Solirubrobacteraceae bacterium]|jgi:GT2 family glycosyltransferase|nr:glycosyltransferase family 2 protein [Solirubrobacteraceae bacterium]
MTAALPQCAEPELSVVMVTHGRWRLTERAIAALVANTRSCFELIVVDNASPDQTRAQLSKLGVATLICNERNVGFGPAVNQGVQHARAQHLLLLNTDAFVHCGWLEPLLETLAEAGVAAVVPRYLHLDGTLQEAGALLARDGTVRVYGDGDDARKSSYRFRRDIDFGGAACMLMRRRAFQDAGGFDEVFAPAYYEDVDLCMRFAQLGLRVRYEPRSSVTHARYGSGAAEQAEQLSRRNRRVFADRWRDHLAPRPVTFLHASEQAVISARDALATPRVLLCHEPREPAGSEIVQAMLKWWPRARLTWLLKPPTDGGFDLETWLEAGVELLLVDDAALLEQRLFHYDLVVRDARWEAGLEALVHRTQPQAHAIAADELGSDAGVMLESSTRTLARAGIR